MVSTTNSGIKIGLPKRSRPRLTGLALASADIVALALAGLVAIYGRWIFEGQYSPVLYLRLWPILGMFLAAYLAAGLYPGAPISPTQEMRRLCIATTLIFLSLGTLTFLFKEAEVYSRAVLLLGWAMAMASVPIGRGLVRVLCAPRPWWGHATVIVGINPTTRTLIRRLRRQTELGLRPVAVYEADPDAPPSYLRLPVIRDMDQLQSLARQRGVRYAMVAPQQDDAAELESLLDELGKVFNHLMVIPRITGMGTLWASAVDLDGTLGLQVAHRLLDPGRRTLKRMLELLITVLSIPVLVPLMVGIAVMIRLDSPGPIIFRQKRLGQGGGPFRIFKFRTMAVDAEAQLEQYLETDEELRREWERDHKLKRDPRITRVGRLLRKTSLDELPQIFNVIAGQMSLVGPRPIINAEIHYYGRHYGIYCQVPPGITGIWQVSGRNRVRYSERVWMDVYYVRNWSVWLDLHLLSRTVLAVFFGRGAY